MEQMIGTEDWRVQLSALGGPCQAELAYFPVTNIMDATEDWSVQLSALGGSCQAE